MAASVPDMAYEFAYNYRSYPWSVVDPPLLISSQGKLIRMLNAEGDGKYSCQNSGILTSLL
jgi:hypothetical protein